MYLLRGDDFCHYERKIKAKGIESVMGLHIIRADITNLADKVDVIVNSANRRGDTIGNGVDRSIYEKAGVGLRQKRKEIGTLEYGQVKPTDSFDLAEKTEWIFHAVVPRWHVNDSNEYTGEYELLAKCYRNSFELFEELINKEKRSIAFPLLATGVYGFPKKVALQIAISEIVAYLLEHKGVSVYLVVFDSESVDLAKQIWPDIDEEIDDDYVEEKCKTEYVKEYMNTTQIVPNNMKELGDVSETIKEYYDSINAVSMEVAKAPKSFASLLGELKNKSGKSINSIAAEIFCDDRKFRQYLNGDKIPDEKQEIWLICFSLKATVAEAALLMKLANIVIDEKDERDKY